MNWFIFYLIGLLSTALTVLATFKTVDIVKKSTGNLDAIDKYGWVFCIAFGLCWPTIWFAIIVVKSYEGIKELIEKKKNK